MPSEFGNWNSIYKKYNRWVKSGKLKELEEAVEIPIDNDTALIDGTYIKAHQHSAGAAKGAETAIGPSRAGSPPKYLLQ
jgi:transposase